MKEESQFRNPQFNQIVNQFEADWTSHKKSDFDAYVNQIDEKYRDKLLQAILKIDIELRRMHELPVPADEYEGVSDRVKPLITSMLVENYAQPESATIAPSRNLCAGESVPHSHLPMQQIGPYKLLQQIGEGGMGTVWMAEQEQPVRRRVALKLVRVDLSSSATIARFEAERQALAMMDHENIAKILDGGQTGNGSPYFVMELIDGIPLVEYCDQNKLNIRQRLKLFLSVCNAIQHAHTKGIIHRDLKPSNVLVALHDGIPKPKVIDFGLAKAIEPTTRLTNQTLLTEFGNVLGTLQYMAPEQAEANPLNVDTRTDVYQLGIMLYELVVGSTPLEKEVLGKHELVQLLAMISKDTAQRPSSRLDTSKRSSIEVAENRNTTRNKLKRQLKTELDWVVLKAIEKDQNLRYETVNGLAADIQQFLNGGILQARPPSWGYQLKNFAHRNKSILTTSGIIISALIVAFVFSYTSYLRERRTSERLQQTAIERAIEAAAVENIARARDEITVAQLEDPKPWLNMIAAFEARMKGNSEKSIEHLEVAYSILPDNKIIESMLADAYLTGGRWESYTQLPVSKGRIAPDSDFERIFIGHAIAWTNTAESQKMLETAVENTKLPLAYVYLARTNASIARATMNFNLAEDAVEQANLGAELLPRSAIARTTQLYAQIFAYDLYQKLLKQESNQQLKRDLESRSRNLLDSITQTVSHVENFELSHQAMVCVGLYYNAAGKLEQDASNFARANNHFTTAQRYFRRSAQAYPFVFEYAFLAKEKELVERALKDLDTHPFGTERSLLCRYLLLQDIGRKNEADELVGQILSAAQKKKLGWAIDLALIAGRPDEAEQLARDLISEFDSSDRGIRVDYLKFNSQPLTRESVDDFVKQLPVVGRGGKYFSVGLRLLARGERTRAMECFKKAEFYGVPTDTVARLAISFLERMKSDATWPNWLRIETDQVQK